VAEHDNQQSNVTNQMNARPMPKNEASELVVQTFLSTNRRETAEKEVWPELGFGFGAWRGWHVEAQASFYVRQGAYGERVRNVCTIDCDDRTASHAMLESLFHAAVTAFDPDHAILTSGERYKAAHSIIRLAEENGRHIAIWEPPALINYKRGVDIIRHEQLKEAGQTDAA
jgi:hypothetical protein